MATSPPAEPRSFADDLRARKDADLASLLRARPDLLNPLPGDVGSLAARALTQASTTRALDRLDLLHLQVLDVVAALPEPASTPSVTAWLGLDAARPLTELHRRGLLWGGPEGWRLVRTVRQVIGTPAGLGPPLVEALTQLGPRRLAQLAADLGLTPAGDPLETAAAVSERILAPGALAEALERAPTAALAALGQLTWGPPYGSVGAADRDVTIATATSAVEWLLARGLLIATDADTVVLPREIAVYLRGGHIHRDPSPDPPPLATTPRATGLIERAAAQSAFALTRHVENLLESWSVDGPPVLRAGGLGVRELKRAANLLDLDEARTAFVIEIAYAAGLLGTSSEVDEAWWPTPAYDEWRETAIAERWVTLAAAWIGTTRVPGLVGGRGERDKVLAALGPELDRALAPEVRRALIDELAATPVGRVAEPGSVEDRLAWRRPRRARALRSDLVAWTFREAEQLGVTGLGALGAAGRALHSGDPEAAAKELEPLLPEPLDHVLLQADLTAVAPGPLESALAHDLALMADVESTGGATVFRFTERSVRRALDAGRTADDLHALLASASRTPVPQPLTYLVDDVSRRHGRLRVGAAGSYLRCDDEALLSQVAADRRSAPLRLRRLATTVLASQSPVESVLERLRDMGYAPVAESPDGAVLLRRLDARRTPERHRPPRLVGDQGSPAETLLAAAVRAVRAGDRASRVTRRPADTRPRPAGQLPRSATADTLAALQNAVTHGVPLWIGYVNNDGQASQRVIEPVNVEGGYVSAFDHLHEEVRTFAVHRITGVSAVDA